VFSSSSDLPTSESGGGFDAFLSTIASTADQKSSSPWDDLGKEDAGVVVEPTGDSVFDQLAAELGSGAGTNWFDNNFDAAASWPAASDDPIDGDSSNPFNVLPTASDPNGLSSDFDFGLHEQNFDIDFIAASEVIDKIDTNDGEQWDSGVAVPSDDVEEYDPFNTTTPLPSTNGTTTSSKPLTGKAAPVSGAAAKSSLSGQLNSDIPDEFWLEPTKEVVSRPRPRPGAAATTNQVNPFKIALKEVERYEPEEEEAMDAAPPTTVADSSFNFGVFSSSAAFDKSNSQSRHEPEELSGGGIFYNKIKLSLLLWSNYILVK